MLRLYDYFRSSSSFRVRLALNYKSLTYEKIAINLLENQQKSTDYLKLNQTGLVPSVIDEDGNLIHQSLAIIEYLDEIYPAKRLLPSAPLDRAYIRSIAFNIAMDIQPLNNLRVLNYLKQKLEQKDVDLWYKHWIATGLNALEQMISSSKFYSGVYCYKDQFTLADVCLLPQLANAKRFQCDVSNYSTLLKIEQQCLKNDFVVKSYTQE